MRIDNRKISELKAEALHHHDLCENHRQGMFKEALEAGNRFRQIRDEYMQSGRPGWKRDWANWQNELYRDHGISDRKVREYVQIASAWHEPWFTTLRSKGWEPNSIAEFHRMAKSVRQDPVAAMRGHLRDGFEVEVLGRLTENQMNFLADTEDNLFWDYYTLVVQNYESWMAYSGEFESEAQYDAAMARRDELGAANRAKRRRRRSRTREQLHASSPLHPLPSAPPTTPTHADPGAT